MGILGIIFVTHPRQSVITHVLQGSWSKGCDTDTLIQIQTSCTSTFLLSSITTLDGPGGGTLSIIPSSDRYNCIALGLWAQV
ncbi:hypothetical protein Baya_6376 [Bagarius yarrelli]|uniref:Uncharacterized protein n=1 Tax=Bagarius yarrelli TaxID=175774 RepID=A0A556TY55_BAGYA|nr:hypothetical protein Baya_6376 [Bagarius yarrelli]